MLICDGIHVDRISERVTILAVFEETRASSYSAESAPFSVTCVLAGGRGRSEIRLEVSHVHAESFEPELIAGATAEVEFLHPKRTPTVHFQFESLVIEERGENVLLLRSGSSEVAERRLHAS